MAFEFVNQTVVSLFNSLSQLKDIRLYDFTFGVKKNKFENWRSWDCKENSWNSFTWAVLLTEIHGFYKQQPVQGAICGPYPPKFSSWKNAVCNSAAHLGHFQSDKWDSWEQGCWTVFINYIFLLAIRLCLRESRIADFTVLNLNVTSLEISQTCSIVSC